MLASYLKCHLYFGFQPPSLVEVQKFFFLKMQNFQDWNPVRVDLFETVGICFVSNKAIKKITLHKGKIHMYTPLHLLH